MKIIHVYEGNSICKIPIIIKVKEEATVILTLDIPSLAHQRCLPSWGPRRTPWFFFVLSQQFDKVDYSNYVFWVSETIIQ